MSELDVLVPTRNRTQALAVTLTSLSQQQNVKFNLFISDQSDHPLQTKNSILSTPLSLIEKRGSLVSLQRHLPLKGICENRNFLLNLSHSPRVLFLDDDIVLESNLLERLLKGLEMTRAAFIGSAPLGLSFIHDVRPHEQDIEFWSKEVKPEKIHVRSKEWNRYALHNAANLYHLQQRLKLQTDAYYRVAWVGGCVLYDRHKLESVGGFSFWPHIPATHCGEEVYVQLKLLEKYGGAGLFPSGSYHLELPTTLPDRSFNVPEKLWEV